MTPDNVWQPIIALLAVAGFLAIATLVGLASPDSRRRAAAWLLASARASEQLREARREVDDRRRAYQRRLERRLIKSREIEPEGKRWLPRKKGVLNVIPISGRSVLGVALWND